MDTQETLCTAVQKGEWDTTLASLYGKENVSSARERLTSLAKRHMARFGAHDVAVFRAPGRVELGGNHTDHQRGLVLAASVSADILAVVSRNTEPLVRIVSEGFPDTTVSLQNLALRADERGTTAALVRGCAAKVATYGRLCGFDACATSDVPSGSGLSSSAAFEVLTAGILAALGKTEPLSPVALAQIGQYAENRYFGKPCGLMDQCASAAGGVVRIDFSAPSAPEIVRVPFDFSACGYVVCTVDSGAGHEDLTECYASIPEELGRVCAFFGKNVLREVEEDAFYKNLPALRAEAGDRAILRAMHVFDENRRVIAETEALCTGDFAAFLRLVQASGESSSLYLQNITPCGAEREQALAVTLAICRRALAGRGACRVHGGGFAGAALAFVPEDRMETFRADVERVLGHGACRVLRLCEKGFTRLA